MEIQYLQIKDKLLDEIPLDVFKYWKFLDEHGNMCNTIQFKNDLERELIKRERYDLLVDIRENPFRV